MSSSSITQDLVGRRCKLPSDHQGLDPFSLEHNDDEGTILAVRTGPYEGKDTLIASVRWDKSGRVIDCPISLLYVSENRKASVGRKSLVDKYPVSLAYLRKAAPGANASHKLVSAIRKRAKASRPKPTVVVKKAARKPASKKKAAKRSTRTRK